MNKIEQILSSIMRARSSFIFSTIIGAIIFLLALAANYFIIHGFINNIHSPETYDLLFDLLPVASLRYVLGWGVLINVLFAIIAVVIHYKKLPFALKTVGLLYFVRAFFISLTPLGVPADRIIPQKMNFLQEMAYSGNDFFFSGHVALPFMLMLIFWDVKWLRYSFMTIALVFAVGVILARTHYSIDVFAAPFIVFTLFILAKYLFEKDWKRN